MGAGVAALAVFLAKAGDLLAQGQPLELLWTCNLGTLGVAVGLLTRSPGLCTGATLWLAFGLPLWALSLWGGDPLLWTSVGTHLGGLSLGAYGALHLGVPPGTWWRATLALVALHLICRLTPPAANLNLAHRVYAGWEGSFAHHLGYLALIGAAALATFAALERGLRRAAQETP